MRRRHEQAWFSQVGLKHALYGIGQRLDRRRCVEALIHFLGSLRFSGGFPNMVSHTSATNLKSHRRLLFQLNDECIEAGWIVKVARRLSQRAVPGA
jgi:hypothetical protein